MAKKKGGPIVKSKKKDIIEELKDIVESGEILGITETELSRKFDTTRVTIRKYLNEIYESVPEEDIRNIRVKLEVMFKKLFREAQKLMLNAESAKEKKEAMEFLLKCIKEFTDFLERFGLKAKAIENINVQGEFNHTHSINVVVQTFNNERIKDISLMEVSDYDRIENNN